MQILSQTRTLVILLLTQAKQLPRVQGQKKQVISFSYQAEEDADHTAPHPQAPLLTAIALEGNII